jgi:hypothetical protein
MPNLNSPDKQLQSPSTQRKQGGGGNFFGSKNASSFFGNGKVKQGFFGAKPVVQQQAENEDSKGIYNLLETSNDGITTDKAATNNFELYSDKHTTPPLTQLKNELGNTIQMRGNRRQAPNAHVGGNGGNMTFLDDGVGGVLGPGDAGFSRRLLAATGDASVGTFNRYYADALHTNVVPITTTIEAQKRIRAMEKQKFVDKAGPGTNGITDFNFTPPSVHRAYMSAADWCQTHMNDIDLSKREEEQRAQEYNAWVPRANGFYTSMARLEAMQEMLGVSDPNQMATALRQGLSDAAAVGARMQLTHDQGRADALPVPPVDNTVAQASQETTMAAREMNVAYLDFQTTIMRQERASTHAEGDTDRTRLGEIEQVKQTIRQIGGTIDLTMSVVSGAPAAISNAVTTVQRAGASLGAARNRRAILRGERPVHNPTYVTVNEEGQMVVRNMQTGTDWAGEVDDAGRNVTTAAPAGAGISLPASVSDILGGIADFAYASEVRAINNRLAQISSRCDAINNSIELTEIKRKTEAFQVKLNAFAVKCNQMQQRINERRQQYLDFGIALDNFARTNQQSQKAGQGTEQNSERYATIMTLTAQIREALAIGNGAKAQMNHTEFRIWAQGLNTVRERHAPRTDIQHLSIPDNEWAALESIYGQLQRFSNNVDSVDGILGSIDTAAQTTIGGLHQGSGGTNAHY